MKRRNPRRRSTSELKQGTSNHYRSIEKNPSKISDIWKRKPYEVGGKKNVN